MLPYSISFTIIILKSSWYCCSLQSAGHCSISSPRGDVASGQMLRDSGAARAPPPLMTAAKAAPAQHSFSPLLIGVSCSLQTSHSQKNHYKSSTFSSLVKQSHKSSKDNGYCVIYCIDEALMFCQCVSVLQHLSSWSWLESAQSHRLRPGPVPELVWTTNLGSDQAAPASNFQAFQSQRIPPFSFLAWSPSWKYLYHSTSITS